MVCEVKNNSEKEFSVAQEQWIETKNSDGFIGQAGGWELNNKKTACIISFWENENSLNLFMKNIHDKIIFISNQSKYYNSIKVDHFNSVLNMEGKFNMLIDVLNNGKLLRIGDCFVKKEKNEHFEMVQKNIWLPGMKKIKGMLGGEFSKAVNNTSRYLISTFWDSVENHNNYTKHELPKFKIKSNVKDDIDQITGRQILLVDAWKIIKKDTV